MRSLPKLPLPLFALWLALAGPAKAQPAPTPGSCESGRAEKVLDANNAAASIYNVGSLFFRDTGPLYFIPAEAGTSPFYATGIWIGGYVGDELRVAAARYENFEFYPGPLNDDGSLPSPAGCDQYDRIYKVSRADIATYEATGIAAPDLNDWPVELGAPVIAAPSNGVDDDADDLVDEGTDGVDNDGDGRSDERDEQERVTSEGRGTTDPDLLYNLGNGDRPEIIGDQGIWWVMNDVGNVHAETGTPPVGVEVQVLAWAFTRSDALGDITFYRYRVIKKSPGTLDRAFLTIFNDPDLGGSGDDFIGVDTTLGLAYVYNADNDDQDDSGSQGYGAAPPAAGYDFFQGPIVNGDTLGITRFTYFNNGGCEDQCDPDAGSGQQYYNYMSGLWKNGTPFFEGGDGYDETGFPQTFFAYPGDAETGEFWSERQLTPGGAANIPGDRRFVVSTGPFQLEQGVPQDIVFGAVYARGADNFQSIGALKNADELAQTSYNVDFELASAPPPPPLCSDASPNPELQLGSGNCLEAVEESGRVTLVWGYPSNSPNYLGSFELLDPLLSGQDAVDSTYNFEGFKVYQYPDANFSDAQRELVATYDLVNGVTTVIDSTFNPEVGEFVHFVAVRGTDSGIQYYYDIPDVTNFTDYYYGITAYSVNLFSIPRVLESAASKITVRPSSVTATNGGSTTRTESGNQLVSTFTDERAGIIQPVARVVDPTRVVDATYTIEFFEFTPEGATAPLLTYRVIKNDSEVVFDGQQVYVEQEVLPSLTEATEVIDGLQFTLDAFSDTDAVLASEGIAADGSPAPAFAGESAPPPDTDQTADETVDGIIEVANPNAAVCPGGTANDGGCVYGGNTVWRDDNATGDYYITGGAGVAAPTGGTLANLKSNGFAQAAPPDNFEIRFTGAEEYAVYFFGATATRNRIARVPFEVWNVGRKAGSSDDVRMIPMLRSEATPQAAVADWTNTFTGADRWAERSGTPLTESVFFVMPDRADGYAQFRAAVLAFGGAGATYDPAADGDTQVDADPDTGAPCENQGYYANFCYRGADNDTAPIARVSFADADSSGTTPPPGTVVRFVTVPKPFFVAGDRFTFNTTGLGFVTNDPATLEDALDLIGIVPNPYMGTSNYETGGLDRVVRFTNLPEEVRIRIYTVAGTLIRELEKDGSSRSLDWDLQTTNRLPIASGMYLVHVEVPGVGERVLKFGVVNRRNQVTVF